MNFSRLDEYCRANTQQLVPVKEAVSMFVLTEAASLCLLTEAASSCLLTEAVSMYV